jgi:FtsP/CotA-like multicopper oxidase with cupredoxin domain
MTAPRFGTARYGLIGAPRKYAGWASRKWPTLEGPRLRLRQNDRTRSKMTNRLPETTVLQSSGDPFVVVARDGEMLASAEANTVNYQFRTALRSDLDSVSAR